MVEDWLGRSPFIVSYRRDIVDRPRVPLFCRLPPFPGIRLRPSVQSPPCLPLRINTYVRSHCLRNSDLVSRSRRVCPCALPPLPPPTLRSAPTKQYLVAFLFREKKSAQQHILITLYSSPLVHSRQICVSHQATRRSQRRNSGSNSKKSSWLVSPENQDATRRIKNLPVSA